MSSATDAFTAPEPYGIMLRRDDPPFKAVADKATADLYHSPEGISIYTKWFLVADSAAMA